MRFTGFLVLDVLAYFSKDYLMVQITRFSTREYILIRKLLASWKFVKTLVIESAGLVGFEPTT